MPCNYQLRIIDNYGDHAPSGIRTWDLSGTHCYLNLQYWRLRPLGHHGRLFVSRFFLFFCVFFHPPSSGITPCVEPTEVVLDLTLDAALLFVVNREGVYISVKLRSFFTACIATYYTSRVAGAL